MPEDSLVKTARYGYSAQGLIIDGEAVILISISKALKKSMWRQGHDFSQNLS